MRFTNHKKNSNNNKKKKNNNNNNNKQNTWKIVKKEIPSGRIFSYAFLSLCFFFDFLATEKKKKKEPQEYI